MSTLQRHLYLLCQLSYFSKSILSLERDFRGHADQSTLRWAFSSSDIKSHYILLVLLVRFELTLSRLLVARTGVEPANITSRPKRDGDTKLPTWPKTYNCGI